MGTESKTSWKTAWNSGVLPAWVAGILAGCIYYATSAPTISWAHESQDSGEFASCAATLGIPHPTGYPLYTIIGWLAIHIFRWVDPGRVMVLLSVVCGAVAVGMASRMGSLAMGLTVNGDKVGKKSNTGIWWGAIAAGFAGVSPLLWSQAVVCEVYAMAIMLQAVEWFFVLKYLDAMRRGQDREIRASVVGIGLTMGFILAHHVSGAAILLPILIIYMIKHPPKWWVELVRGVAAMIPGFLFYLYLPIRSAQNPVLDWGNPENWVNFIRHVTAAQYRGYMFHVQWIEYLRRIAAFDWDKYWGLGGTVLIIAGLAVVGLGPRKSYGKVLAPAILAYILFTLVFASGYHVTDFDIFYYPMLIPASIVIAPGIMWLSSRLGRYNRWLPSILALAVVISLGVSVRDRWSDMDISNPMLSSAAFYAYRSMAVLPDGALVITNTDGNFFSIVYAVNCGIRNPSSGEFLPPRPDVDVVVVNWVKYDWFRENVMDRWGTSGRLRFISPSHERDAALKILIDQNLAIRPVYVDAETRSIIESGVKKYETIPSGPLFWIKPE